MRYLILTTIIFLTASTALPQKFNYKDSIGEFKNASAFYMSPSGFLYVTDAGSDEVFKLDTLGNVVKYVGGYGWDQSSFDIPSDVFASTLSVYVCDKNNHRVQRFDKDLNFISQLSTRKSDDNSKAFGYPLGCATSNQGDLFILDSENKRIIKFDLFGNFILNFGGYDSGVYALSDPICMAISPGNNIFVLDKERIVVFDQYGNGLSSIKSSGKFTSIRSIFNALCVNTGNEVLIARLGKGNLVFNQVKFSGLPVDEEIISSLIYNENLYILTRNDIRIFNPETK